MGVIHSAGAIMGATSGFRSFSAYLTIYCRALQSKVVQFQNQTMMQLLMQDFLYSPSVEHGEYWEGKLSSVSGESKVSTGYSGNGSSVEGPHMVFINVNANPDGLGSSSQEVLDPVAE